MGLQFEMLKVSFQGVPYHCIMKDVEHFFFWCLRSYVREGHMQIILNELIYKVFIW